MKAAVFAALLCFVPAGLFAQPATSGRIEVAGGLRWSGATTFSGVDARENIAGGRTSPVFASRTQLEASPGVEGRVGVMLTGALQVEVSLGFNQTALSTELARDTDGAAGVTASEQVSQYLVEAGLVVRLPRRRGGRLTPFVSAGGGYLRHLHEGRTLAEAGRSYYAGAGVYYAWRTSGRGWMKGAGLRADLRASILEDGALLDSRRHAAPVAGAGLFVRF